MNNDLDFTPEKKRAKWGDGPWVDEPDREEWRHSGLPCLITRAPLGNLCGYVAVPPGHPWHGQAYDDIDAAAHGGLTYADRCQGNICHVPREGEPDDVWWLGFDCAHWCDIIPMMASTLPAQGGLPDYRYRDLAYVRAEVERLAEQAAAARRLNVQTSECPNA
jgi:hypothetical protein